LLDKVSHNLLGLPFDLFHYSHGHQKAYYRSSENESNVNEFPEELSFNQRCNKIRLVDGFPLLNGFCHWHATGSYEFNFWRKHQFVDREDDLAWFKTALEPKDGALADIIEKYTRGNLRLRSLAVVFKYSMTETVVRTVERILVCFAPAEIYIWQRLFGTYWPFKSVEN